MHIDNVVDGFATESVNPRTIEIDRVPIEQMLQLISQEDQAAVEAVREVIPAVATAVRMVARAFMTGGRLFYVGSGTSGRIGELDASEIPPTFGVEQGLVQAVQGPEDRAERGGLAMERAGVGPEDVVIALSANGHAGFGLAALEEARRRKAYTIGLTANPTSALAMAGDLAIVPETGPEVIAGSTRMKAGTAQKLVLNMITTGAMVVMGRTYGNLMVHFRPANRKLRQRAIGQIMMITGVDAGTAEEALRRSGDSVSRAAVMLVRGVGPDEAGAALVRNQNRLRPTLEEI